MVNDDRALKGKENTADAFARLFAVTYSIAMLAGAFDGGKGLLGALQVVAMLAVVVSRGDVRAFVVANLVEIWATHQKLPWIPNHILFELFASVTIVLGYATSRSARSMAGLLEAVAPTLRASLIVLYFFAVLHKLNHAYFETGNGCGAVLAQELARRFPFMPTGGAVRQACTMLSLATEAAIFAGLALPRFRYPALLLGIGFHAFLGWLPHVGLPSFSSMLFALYLLFLPQEARAKLIETLRSNSIGRVFLSQTERKDWIRAVLAGAAFVAALATLLTAFYGSLLEQKGNAQLGGLPDNLSFALFLLLSAFALLWAVRAPRQGRPAPVERAFSLSPLMLISVVVFLNGMSPYLGLKTQTSFSMFSNLSTELGKTNHLFIPASWQIFDYQKEPVRVLARISPHKSDLNAVTLTVVEFRRYFIGAAKRTRFRLEFRGWRGEIVKGEPPPPEVAILERPLNYFERRWIPLRPIEETDSPCRQ